MLPKLVLLNQTATVPFPATDHKSPADGVFRNHSARGTAATVVASADRSGKKTAPRADRGRNRDGKDLADN